MRKRSFSLIVPETNLGQQTAVALEHILVLKENTMTQFAIKNLIRYSPQIAVVNIKSWKYLALICAGVGASRHLFEPKPKQ